MSHVAKFVLSIAAGQTTSPALSSLISKGNARSTIGNSSDMMIYAPATLTGTVTVQVSNRYGDMTRMVPLQSGGQDVTLTAGRAIQLPIGAMEDIRFVSSGAEAAQRDIGLNFQITMGS